ncbi:peptidoglycan-binding protein [Amphibacillus indicireducens]|uniref:Mannosyl-glycoprotein endo-beta-N-acetylglucosamidase-like domain-containing protein n=1 Tax=Amphibacillus indicireducens TaxID=1076330 RepID=A0ABP7VAR1_9BACI
MKFLKYLFLGFAVVFIIHFSTQSSVAGITDYEVSDTKTSDASEGNDSPNESEDQGGLTEAVEEELEDVNADQAKEGSEIDDVPDEETSNLDDETPVKKAEEHSDIEEEKPVQARMSLNRATVSQSTFQLGDRHESIPNLKRQLNRVGFSGITVTDYFGEYTKTKVEEFQAYYGLSVNGRLDNATIQKLNQVYNSPYQLGKTHEDIKDIKRKLNQLGFSGITVTAYFGEYMEGKVEDFQRAYGLTVNGIVDEVTLNKLNSEAAKTNFQVGDSHPNISNIKQKLNRIGFSGILVTNYYGDFTKQRVEEFQRYYGLSVTGRTDDATIQKLDEVYNSPFQLNRRHNDIPDIKRKLNHLSYGRITVTSLYGSFMERQVRAFQRDHGLVVNGIVDDITSARIEAEISRTNFGLGDRHGNISNIKRKLNRVGFSGILVTDYYGDFTADRVREFQRYYGLSVTGRTDDATIQKLDEVYNSPFQLNRRHNDIPDIKRKLNHLSYGRITVTSLYGSFMERQVRAFQRDHGLVVNGIVDDITSARIEAEISRTNFGLGDRHGNISEIKKKLNHVGFSGILVTDYYGDFTADRVRDFQRYYGLSITGRTDDATIQKLDEVYNSPFQLNRRHDDTRDIKEKLNQLGYGRITVTNLYGSYMESQVKAFQRDHGLVVNGIADSVTLARLDSVFESSKLIITYSDYNLSLAQAVNIQMAITNPPPQTDLYRNDPAYVSARYIEEIQFGKIDASSNVYLRTRAEISTTTQKHLLSPGTELIVLDTVQGSEFRGSRSWYKVEYQREVLYVHTSLVAKSHIGHRTTANLNVRAGTNTTSHVFGTLSNGSRVTVLEKTNSNWYRISYQAWRNATRADTQRYVDPTNNNDMQHLDLSSNMGATAAELNKFLEGKGILEGMGAAFVEASLTHNVNELYLISHALLETGQGTSRLARGIVVNGTTVYNMFGIGAGDRDPNGLGSREAYRQGWDTPEKAIIGGAKFIGDSYIHGAFQQNTLYKMRWNPLVMANTGNFGRQYATDIGWAVKQTTNLQRMIDQLSNPRLKYDFVRYN